jgi:hypothetical protein
MSVYSMAPYKHNFGQTITTDVEGVAVDRAFLAHYHIDAEDAPAASSDGVLAATNLGASVQAITTGITNPAVPRNLTVAGNVTGVTGTVKVYGTDFAGEAIEESFTLNGQTPDAGDLAFKTITKVDLPAQTHTPAAQTETIEVTNECTNTEEISVSVTATTLLGEDSGESVTVALDSTVHTTPALVAAAVVEALNDNDVISAVFIASNEGAVITLATKEPVANDSSLEITFSLGTSGVTVGSSTNGTTGVPYDVVSIGWGDKFGIPYKLYADELVILKLVNKAKEVSEGTVTADATDLAKNVYDPTDATLGVDIDLYIIV